MTDLLGALVENFPQLLFFLFVVAAAGLVLREFRAIRSELSTEVGTRVRAEIGALIGDVMQQAEALRKRLAQAADSAGELARQREEFAGQAREAQEEITATLVSARSRAAELRELIPSSEEMSWIAPRELVLRARGAASWKDAYPFLASIDDSNATSKDLEFAGDTCRDPHRFFVKAIEFYERALAKDPENVTARTELLALLAETRGQHRKQYLGELRALVAEHINTPSVVARYSNALIELDRYQELASFAEEQLQRDAISPATATLLRRNLGVAYSRLDRIDDAMAQYEEVAKQLAPPATQLAIDADLRRIEGRLSISRLLDGPADGGEPAPAAAGSDET